MWKIKKRQHNIMTIQKLRVNHFLWINWSWAKKLTNFDHHQVKNSTAKLTLLHNIKVAFIQKGLMISSFLQTEEPNYFPELKFWSFFFHSKWLKSCQIRTWSCSNVIFEHSEQLYLTWFKPFRIFKKNQNFSSGK